MGPTPNLCTGALFATGRIGASWLAMISSRRRAHWVPVTTTLLLALGLTAGPALAQRGAPPTFATIVQAVAPAVVTIAAVVEPKAAATELQDDKDPEEPGPIGSGVIIDPKGVVLTNAHVADAAAAIEVVTNDGRRFRPTRIVIDGRSDLAVLVIGDGTAPFPFARLADSDSARVGDWVVAIGAPYGLQTTVTAGIISARGAEGTGPLGSDYIQTSAVLRLGSSGGPLVNLDGEIVGINTVFAFEVAGLAFTIPSNAARTVATQLIENGRVSRPWLGLVTQPLTPELARGLALGASTGLLVSDVVPASPGAAGGLHPGDLVMMLDARRLLARVDLTRALAQARPGQAVTLQVRRRNGTEHTLSVTLGEERDAAPSSLTTYRVPELGCVVRSLTPDLGVSVVQVNARAGTDGLRAGDIVREVNRTRVRTMSDFAQVVDRLRAGDDVAVLVQRGSLATYVALKAEAR
jgi:serine protease Do